MTAESNNTIVVCGSTGKQGGAVIDALVDDGRWNVVALTRNPAGAAAEALRARGVEVRAADLVDGDSLVEAFRGAYGVYGVTTPLTPRGKIELEYERRQGTAIVNACVANDTRHLVMSSVLRAVEGQADTLEYISVKFETEGRIVSAGIPHTFLRPGSFMDEIGGEYLPVKNRVITGQADDDAKIPYVACRDIGAFAAMAFADPATFMGRGFNLVGDFISGEELARVLTKVDPGRPYRHKAPPMWLMHVFARTWIPLRRAFEDWGRPPHPPALLEALEETRRLRPETLTFEQYLRSIEFGTASRSPVA